MPATWRKLAYEDDVPLLTLYTAHTILASTSAANVATSIALAANEFIGRLGSANIANLTAANVRTIINVEDGADVTDAAAVSSAGAIMKTLLAANGDMIYASAANTPANLAKGNAGEVLTMGAANAPEWAAAASGCFPNTANATTRAALSPTALGETCFQVDTLSCYVCTVLA